VSERPTAASNGRADGSAADDSGASTDANADTHRHTDADAGDDRDAAVDGAALRGELDALRAENRRLRREYLRARQTQYRDAALGMFALGAVALVGAASFPAFRTVLLVLAGTGGFGGVLFYFLTPDRLVPVSVGRAAYDAHAATGRDLRGELGLRDASVYVPLREEGTTESVRLFLPQASEWDLPGDDALGSLFVDPDAADTRGVSLTPTAATLYDEFARGAGEPRGSEADDLLGRLRDAAVEQFELARRIDGDVDEAARRVAIRVTDPAYGALTEFDHPLVSFVGVGLAAGLSSPVAVDAVERGGDETFVVGYRYDVATGEGGEAGESPDADADERAASAET
jgi:hypothetical protein